MRFVFDFCSPQPPHSNLRSHLHVIFCSLNLQTIMTFSIRVIYNCSIQNMMHMNSCPAKSSQKAKDRSNIMAPLTTQQLRKKQEGYINTQGNLSYHSMRRQRETVDQRNPRPRFAIGTVGASTIILSLYSCCPLGSLNPFLPSSI